MYPNELVLAALAKFFLVCKIGFVLACCVFTIVSVALPPDSGRKVLQDLNNQNDDRVNKLEDDLKSSQESQNESERKFDEVG